MSELWVTSVINQEGTGAPSFPNGLTGTAATFTGPVSVGGTLTYEDVKNVDSVGLITARTGIKVTAGGIDVNAGGVDVAAGDAIKVGAAVTINTTGIAAVTGIITANSFVGDVTGSGVNLTNLNASSLASGTVPDARFPATLPAVSGANLTGIEAAPTIQGVADGSIAAEGATIVKSDGKLTAVVGFTDGLGSEQSFVDDMSETKNEGAQSWDETNSQIMVLYRELNAPNNTYAIVGTVSGTTVTWSSTPVQLSSGNGGELAVCCYSSGVHLCVYRDNDFEYLRVLTVSGTGTSATIALGTALDIAVGSANSMDEPNLIYDPDNNKAFLAFRDSHDNRGSAYMATISGTGTGATVTIGTRFDICTSEQPYMLQACYDTTNNKMIVAWNNSNQFRTRTLSISGSTITGTNMENSAFSGFSNTNPAIAYDFVNNCFWASAMNNGNTVQYYRQGKYSSGSDNLTWPGDVTAVSGLDGISDGSMCVVCDLLGNILFFGVNSGGAMEYVTATLDPTSGVPALLIQTTSAIFAAHAGGGQDAGTPIPLSYGRVSVGPYRTNAANDKGVIKMKQFKTSNATTENFLGFSKAAYTDGQTATIKVVGNVSTKSGLTPGKKYYLQNNGSLATGADDPSIVAGKALSATSLLIQPT